jgi:hypothetical protein
MVFRQRKEQLSGRMGTVIRRLAWFIGTVVAVCFAASCADAHFPRFTKIEKIALPDGRAGEMRLLQGDGILFGDPVRVLVLDEEGHLIARSLHSHQLTFLCSRERNCLVVDLEGHRAFELDPAAFRAGPPIPEDRERLGEFEAGEESWGFEIRDASYWELLSVNVNMAKELNILLLFPLGWGSIASILLFGGRWRLEPEGGLIDRIAGVVVLVARLTGIAFILCIGLGFAMYVGAYEDICFAFFFAGAVLFPVIKWLHRKLRTVTASVAAATIQN